MKRTGPAIVFRDLLLGLVGILFMALVLVLIQVSAIKKTNDGQTPPGNVTVFITWPPGDNDVDLWVMGPGEQRPVGYSNKGGLLWNLLRDDLGNASDMSDTNMESAYSRGAPAGEYQINLHCFRCRTFPQKIQVEVGLNDPKTGAGTVVIATATVSLMANGQERTAVRFKIDAAGKFVNGSLNAVFRPLRSAVPNAGSGFGQ